MLFFLFNIVLFILFLFLLLVYSMLWPPDSPWAPWWRTNKKTAEAICRLAKVSDRDVVYDLGCGDGTLILTVAKNFGAKAVGVEIDHLRYLIALLRVLINHQSKNILVKRKNFFDTSISQATIVVVYLVPKTLEKLKEKFLKELKPGTKIISYKYEMSLPLVKYDQENQLRLYKIS